MNHVFEVLAGNRTMASLRAAAQEGIL